MAQISIHSPSSLICLNDADNIQSNYRCRSTLSDNSWSPSVQLSKQTTFGKPFFAPLPWPLLPVSRNIRQIITPDRAVSKYSQSESRGKTTLRRCLFASRRPGYAPKSFVYPNDGEQHLSPCARQSPQERQQASLTMVDCCVL